MAQFYVRPNTSAKYEHHITLASGLHSSIPRESHRVAKQVGFSLHAGVMAEPHQRDVLERLCRYISRPAISERRLALTGNGKVQYELKTPYREPAKRGKGRKTAEEGCVQEKTFAERRKAMTCTLKGHREMQRLKRVFNIDIEKCERCGGQVKVISCIEAPEVIEKILQNLALKESLPLPRVSEARGPPEQAALFPQ